MKIIITGIGGFIGSHLAERLMDDGHEVYGLDADPKNWSTRHVYGSFVTGKCQDLQLLRCVARGCDFVFHLASTVGVSRVLENPSECIGNNIQSLRAVLSLGIPGLFTSTSEVYGKNVNPLSEDSDLIFSSKARWSYSASKLIGEWLALGCDWKVVRLFNVIGPRQSNEYGAVVPRFVRQALSGEEITVYGTGSQIRSFIDVKDCVDILVSLMHKKFDIVNVGSDRNIVSINSLAEIVANVLDTKLIKNIPYNHAYRGEFEECQVRIPNLTKLRSLIGMREDRTLEETIRDIADSLKVSNATESEYGPFMSSITVQPAQ